MGTTSYERLSASGAAESRSLGGAWAAVRRGLARLCAVAARRQGRWAPARRMLVRARGRRSRKVAAACGYDEEGYARNFDDGLWKADEGAPWSAAAVRPSLGACRIALAVSAAQ